MLTARRVLLVPHRFRTENGIAQQEQGTSYPGAEPGTGSYVKEGVIEYPLENGGVLVLVMIRSMSPGSTPARLSASPAAFADIATLSSNRRPLSFSSA